MNIKKIVFPQHKGLENKWWQRLINVLIMGSTIIILLLSIAIVGTNESWKDKKYYYSFEDNYQNIKGIESLCYFHYYKYINHVSISCGNLTNKEFVDRIAQSRGTSDKVAEYRKNGATDDSLLSNYIDSNNPNLFNNKEVKYKEKTNIIYSELLKEMGLAILIIFSWFIFWESIFYRTVLYVVYGNKNIANK